MEYEKNLGDLVDWVCGFDDKRLIEEIRILEHLICCDGGR